MKSRSCVSVRRRMASPSRVTARATRESVTLSPGSTAALTPIEPPQPVSPPGTAVPRHRSQFSSSPASSASTRPGWPPPSEARTRVAPGEVHVVRIDSHAPGIGRDSYDAGPQAPATRPRHGELPHANVCGGAALPGRMDTRALRSKFPTSRPPRSTPPKPRQPGFAVKLHPSARIVMRITAKGAVWTDERPNRGIAKGAVWASSGDDVATVQLRTSKTPGVPEDRASSGHGRRDTSRPGQSNAAIPH